jgi:hypothetical protein
MTISENGELKAKGNLLAHQDQTELEAFLANYCEKPLRGSPKVLHSPGHAFTDSRTQDLTLINLASIRALEEKIGTQLDPLRFRANLYFDCEQAWLEHDWVGKNLKIGDVIFRVRKRTQRCAATNANLETGERDQMIPKALLQHFDHADMGRISGLKSTCAIFNGKSPIPCQWSIGFDGCLGERLGRKAFDRIAIDGCQSVRHGGES